MNIAQPPQKRRKKGIQLVEGDAELADTLTNRRIVVKRRGTTQQKSVETAFPPLASQQPAQSQSFGEIDFTPNFDDMPFTFEDIPTPPRRSKVSFSFSITYVILINLIDPEGLPPGIYR